MLGLIHFPAPRQNRFTHEQALAAALNSIEAGNQNLAKTLHDSKALPPYSACIEDDRLRLAFLSDEILVAVGNGNQNLKVRGLTTCEKLLNEAAAIPTLKLSFKTPTSFGLHGQSYVLPTPEKVFYSLRRRWELAGGPLLPELDWGSVNVLNVRLDTVEASLRRYSVFGVVGHIIYRLPDSQAHYFHALARFAEYAGVGQRTAQGFGRTVYETRT